MTGRTVKLTGDLPDGQEVKVEVDLEEVWDAISGEWLAEEFNFRLETGDKACAAMAAEIEPDEPFDYVEGEDALFKPLSAWDKDELLKAVREDDGRRAIDVLKRASA